MKGKITSIQNNESIVWLTLRRLLFFKKKIPMDHRMFYQMTECEQQLLGRRISYDGSTIFFEDGYQ